MLIIRCISVFHQTLIIVSAKVYSQDIEHKSFYNYFGKHFNIPESVKKDCNWYYAMVRLEVDAANTITNVNFVNETNITDELKQSFMFLKNYQFGKDVKINSRPVFFPVLIDQRSYNTCNDSVLLRPALVAIRLIYDFKKLHNENPNAIVIYEPLTSIVADAIKD